MAAFEDLVRVCAVGMRALGACPTNRSIFISNNDFGNIYDLFVNV